MQIINVMAVSLDGRIASHPGETDKERRRLGFTSEEDRAHLLELVATADGVIVGSSSILASGGAFEGLNAKGVHPVWAVLTNRGLPPTARFLRQHKLPRWLVSKSQLALPPDSGVRNLVYGEAAAAPFVAAQLREAGCQRVLLFGGAGINQQFYAAGLVDQLIITICPLIVGASAAVPLVTPPLPSPTHLSLVASQPNGNLVFLTYNVQKNNS